MVVGAKSDLNENPLAWLRNRWGVVGGAAILYTILYALWTYFHWGNSRFNPLIANLAFFPITFFTLIASWRVYVDKALNSRIRRAWFLFSLSVFLQIVGDVVAFYEDTILQLNIPYFLSDIFYLAFYPFVLWGLLTLPGVSLDRKGWLRFALDLVLVMIAAWMMVWYFIIVPAVNIQNDLIAPLIAASYPVSNLVVLGGVISLLSRGRRQNTMVRPSLLIFLAGLLCFVAANLLDTYFTVRDVETRGTWIGVGWLMAYIFFALAAIRQRSPLSTSYADSLVSQLLDILPMVLPFAAIGMGYGLVIFVARSNLTFDNSDVRGVFFGAAVLTVFVVARQIITLRDNLHLNDELRQFSETLEQRVAQRTQELQQSQEALLASEKMAIIGTLAAGVAHEISNPLSAIITSSEHLESELNVKRLSLETLGDYLAVITRSASHAMHIAQALRNQSRGRTPELVSQKISDVLNEALMLMDGQIKRWNRVKVVKEIDPDLPPVLCDRNQIAQVVFNLLNNARDAMPQGGAVKLRAWHDGAHVRIEVSDQGVGIPPEMIEDLFKTFFTTKPIGKGTGLGLSIVREIVQNHKGTIDVKSEGAGKGATFVVTLPVAT
ncbi:MAG: HAMP domain-containing sensor histidine kinase [Chloroflexota bacterium]